MGASIARTAVAAAVAVSMFAAAAAQDPPKPALPALHPEVVLSDAVDPVPLASFGLGDGGIAAASPPERLRWDGADVLTPGGVRVACRGVGVKVTFPSGRELLLAADGALHLRGGEAAGPFPHGVELRLGDGASVRVVLGQEQRVRVRDVVVVAGERALQPWRRGLRAAEDARPAFWGGVRLCCCGDGGDVFRAIALGPLVTLERVLTAKGREAAVPERHLVVLTTPLVQAMAALLRQHRTPDPEVRSAAAAVAAVVDRGDAVFAAGAALRRAEARDLRWVLRGGYELRLELEGQSAPRLALHAGQDPLPMVEWTLTGGSAAFLGNPRREPGAGRWHGNGVRLPAIAGDLQARRELFEFAAALQVIRRLRR
jgi:hypothetical protein